MFEIEAAIKRILTMEKKIFFSLFLMPYSFLFLGMINVNKLRQGIPSAPSRSVVVRVDKFHQEHAQRKRLLLPDKPEKTQLVHPSKLDEALRMTKCTDPKFLLKVRALAAKDDFHEMSLLASGRYVPLGDDEEKPPSERINHYQKAIELFRTADQGENDTMAFHAFINELKVITLAGASSEDVKAYLQTEEVKEKIRIVDENLFGDVSQELGEWYMNGWFLFPKDPIQAKFYLEASAENGNHDSMCHLRRWNGKTFDER
jgi:hypothetical protein